MEIDVQGDLAGILTIAAQTQNPAACAAGSQVSLVAGQDLNLRPSGYEPDELPGCSTPRQGVYFEPVGYFFAIIALNVCFVWI